RYPPKGSSGSHSMIVRWSARPPPRLAAAKIEATARPEPMPRPLPGLLFASPLSGYYPRTNGFCNGFDHKIDLCFGKLGKHRQGEKLVRDLFRDRERAALMTQADRSEEHTSELQSPYDLVCRLLLEKKKKKTKTTKIII